PIEPVNEVDFKVLEEAQNRKMDRLIGMLNLKPSDRILEIGCGWGSCAVRAVQGIICPDAYYDRYCRSSDFIKKYIFPGGHMPSI
ncbi:hypothetical protein TELCIR_21241, partial [Teladorsagia circumcincta]